MYQAPKSTLYDSIPSQFSSEQDPFFYIHIWANLFIYVSNMVHVKETNFKKITSKFGLVNDCVTDLETYIYCIHVRIVWSFILFYITLIYPQCQPTLQVIPRFGSPLSPFKPCRDFVSSMFLCRKGEFPSHFHTYHVVRGRGGFCWIFCLSNENQGPWLLGGFVGDCTILWGLYCGDWVGWLVRLG